MSLGCWNVAAVVVTSSDHASDDNDALLNADTLCTQQTTDHQVVIVQRLSLRRLWHHADEFVRWQHPTVEHGQVAVPCITYLIVVTYKSAGSLPFARCHHSSNDDSSIVCTCTLWFIYLLNKYYKKELRHMRLWLLRAGSGEKEVRYGPIPLPLLHSPSPLSLTSFSLSTFVPPYFPSPTRVWENAVSFPSGSVARTRLQTHVCDILRAENAFGGNKTVSMYDRRQKEVVVWFQAGQRSAGVPYRPIPSHFEHCDF